MELQKPILKKRTHSMQLPHKLWERLRKLKEETGISIKSFVAMAVKEKLDSEGFKRIKKDLRIDG